MCHGWLKYFVCISLGMGWLHWHKWYLWWTCDTYQNWGQKWDLTCTSGFFVSWHISRISWLPTRYYPCLWNVFTVFAIHRPGNSVHKSFTVTHASMQYFASKWEVVSLSMKPAQVATNSIFSARMKDHKLLIPLAYIAQMLDHNDMSNISGIYMTTNE
jgi:hypothetical protein